MTKDCPSLLPDYSAIEINGRYRPLFKLMADDRWRMVRSGGRPVECDTLAEANRVARSRVQEILNPPILVEAGGHDDVLGIAAWRERKVQEAEAEAERRRTFSHEPAAAMFRNGRTIEIVRKRRRG